jgi:two-component system, LytTR family, response regulator
MATGDIPLGQALGDAAANVLPLSVLALMTHSLLNEHVLQRPVWTQAAIHMIMAIAFATLWYGAILLMLAFISRIRFGVFELSPFYPVAFTWQAFQGLILYTLVAATCYALRGGRASAPVTLVASTQGSPPLDRYLTKSGDEINPVQTCDIVTITGAQDYSEVAMIDQSVHLVRMTLGEFEERLDRNRFLRVHRSAIVNLDHLERAEPAGGGRLLIHMCDGSAIRTSRAGSQLIRQLIV